jgi:hypothetical protein
MHTIFWLENLKGRRNHLEDLGIDRKTILEWILGKWGWRVWTFHLAQDRDPWWALVNTVMNLWVP